MKKKLIYKDILYFSFIVLLISACGSDKLNLEDRDNELIPNYSNTLDLKDVTFSMRSDIIALDDDNLIMAIEELGSNIELIQINQEFINEEWLLSNTRLLDIGFGQLSFFNSLEDEFLMGYTNENGVYTIQIIDESLNLSTSNNTLESFIDTFYNDIDSLYLSSFTYVEESNKILLGGQVYTQGTTFSCLLNLDRQLNPIWIKTYFENSNITDVKSINRDTFYVINNSPDGADLIRDNENSQAYSKYDLSNDKLFFGVQSFIDDERLFLTGIHNDIGRTIEVDINSNIAFINEVEIYPVSDFKTVYLTRDNVVSAGIQIQDSFRHQFSSEIDFTGSKWCHRYSDEQYHKILDIIEMPEKGIMISSIVESAGLFYIHLTRIDEEGATFVNEYTENCL